MSKSNTTDKFFVLYNNGEEFVEYCHRNSAMRSARCQVKLENVRIAEVVCINGSSSKGEVVRTYIVSRGVWDSFAPDQAAA